MKTKEENTLSAIKAQSPVLLENASQEIRATTVRYDGINHDPLSSTEASRAAVAQAVSMLRDVLVST